MNSKHEVYRYVAKIVEKYLESGNSSRRCASLAKKSGCSRSTIKRLVEEEVTTIHADTAWSLLKIFNGIEESLDIMEKAYPKWYKVHGEHWRDIQIKSLSAGHLVWNKARSHFLDRAGTMGVTKDWVIKKYGEEGLKDIKYLLENGIIEIRNGKYYTVHGLYTDSSVSVIRRMIYNAKSFDHERVGDGYFWSRFVEALTDKHGEEFRELCRNFLSDTRELMKRNRSSTEIKRNFFILNLFGCLLNEED